MKENHIQLLHGGVNHWYLSFDTRSGQVQVYDSLRTNISSSVTKQRLKALYKSLISKDGKVTITMVPAHMQKDGKNCRLFAIAFAADILKGKSPKESGSDISKIRENLIECLEKEKLSVFPKHASVAVSQGYNIFDK